MKEEELENLMKAGKLILNKRDCGVIYREKGWRGQKWDDTTNASWDTTRIPYKKYQYEARTPDMPEYSFYKLTKKVYEHLQSLAS